MFEPAGLVDKKGWTKGCSISHKCRGLWPTGDYFGSQGERSTKSKRFHWLVHISERSYWFASISERFYWLVLGSSCENSMQILAAPSSPTEREEFHRISRNSLPHLITLPVTRSICLRSLARKKQRRWVIRVARVKMCAWRIQKPGLQTCSLTKLSIRRLRKAQERKVGELEFSITNFSVTGDGIDL